MTGRQGFARLAATALPVAACLLLMGTAEPAVHVASMDSVGPRPVEQQTRTAIVRDYLQSWQCLDRALRQNHAESLDACFVGQAKDTLVGTIRAQQALGIETGYRDQSHDIKVVFYSPEGLSIELVDDVEYDMEVHGRAQATQHVRSRYVAVLSPTESKWKVRIFQGGN